MKNLIIVLFIVMYFITPIGVQAEHNSDNNKSQASVTVKKKDPKLFDKFIVKEINKTQYQQKLSSDNKKYSGIKKQLNNDQYSVYRIFEKILRANNLEYQNWRIGIKRTATNINASAGSANLILINSALYDSLYNDKDALAFVISHETAHFLLNHNKKAGKIVYAINRLERKQYNLDDIFRKKKTIIENEENNQVAYNILPVELKKERFYEKILNFLKKLFHL